MGNDAKNTTAMALKRLKKREKPAGKSWGRAGEELSQKTKQNNRGIVAKMFGFSAGRGRAPTPINIRHIVSAGKSLKVMRKGII